MKKNILNIETVHQCNCCLGCKTLHPLISVIDLSKANLEQRTLKFGFYTVILIEGHAEDFMYVPKYYDSFSKRLVAGISPGFTLSHFIGSKYKELLILLL